MDSYKKSNLINHWANIGLFINLQITIGRKKFVDKDKSWNKIQVLTGICRCRKMKPDCKIEEPLESIMYSFVFPKFKKAYVMSHYHHIFKRTAWVKILLVKIRCIDQVIDQDQSIIVWCVVGV